MIFGGRISRRQAVHVILGAVLGYAFYYYIGCANGSCLITSNPYISTVYGGFMGWLISGTKA